MRSRYLVAYDIADKSRLRRTHDVMLGFGDQLQYSVFDCMLSDKEVVLLVAALTEVVSASQDRVVFARLGPEGRSSSKLRFLGIHPTGSERGPLIV